MKYKIRAKLWLWNPEKGSWHFATIHPEISKKISDKFKNLNQGWGSLPVKIYFANPEKKKAKIILETSIFPDTKSYKEKVYILPVKKKIRQQLGIQNGDIIEFELEIKKLCK